MRDPCRRQPVATSAMRAEPLKLAGKLVEHRPALLVAHELAAPAELVVVGLEQVYRCLDERQVRVAPRRRERRGAGQSPQIGER